MLILLALIAGILAFSAFFSGAEAALISVSEAEVEAMAQHGGFAARMLSKTKKQMNRCVIGIVIMNNIVNIVGSILVGQMVIRLYGDAMLGVATTALTFGIVVFSEILPKSIGIHYAPRIAPVVAPAVWLIVAALYPFILFLEFLTGMFRHGERRVGTEAQIRALVRIGYRAGHIENDEGQLIQRAFILNDKTAADIMTPLNNIADMPGGISIRAAAEKAMSDQHSRYPVFGASANEVKGIVMDKDILEALAKGFAEKTVASIVREAIVVDAHTRSDALLLLFRDRHKHLAVVQDAGKTVGLVTLEDVLEELVGEIEDETDAA